MENTYLELAQRATNLLAQNPNYRVLILLAGAPGSGKLTVAEKITTLINNQYKKNSNLGSRADNNEKDTDNGVYDTYSSDINNYITNKVTSRLDNVAPSSRDVDYEDDDFTPAKTVSKASDEIVISARSVDNSIKVSVPAKISRKERSRLPFAQLVPMDGFHLPRDVLSKFKDPENAFARRGAPFTFDSLMVAKLVELLKSTCDVIITNGYSDPIFTNSDESTVHNKGERILGPDSNADSESIISSLESSKLPLRRSSVSQIFDPADLCKDINNSSNNNDSNDASSMLSFSEFSTSEESTIWKLIDGRNTLIPDIHIPNFNHALKDPTPFDITIKSTTRIVIVEGLYLLLNSGNWSKIHDAIYNSGHEELTLVQNRAKGDLCATTIATVSKPNARITSRDSKKLANYETWKIHIDEGLARARVSKRHVQSGIAKTLEEGAHRYDSNDCINGRLVESSSYDPDVLIVSEDN